MCPTKSVTTRVTPASTAASATSTSRPSVAASIVDGVGWASSQRKKIRTLSNPALAARRKSRRVTAGSYACSHAIATSAGQ